MDRYFILGGRSGTTLVHKCLLSTEKFINWGNDNNLRGFLKLNIVEPPTVVRIYICSHFPNRIVEEELFETAPENFTLAKHPTFALVLPLIVKRYKPKFIILDRDLNECVLSYLRVGWGGSLFDYAGLRERLESMGANYSSWLHVITTYFKLLRECQNNALLNYPPERILRVEFNNLMNNFNEEMERISKFTGIEPELEKWNILRRIKLQVTTTNVLKYIKRGKKNV